MTPPPSRAGDAIEIAGRYQYDATYRGWAPQRFWHQSRMRVALEMLAPLPGMAVLDVGCGSGVFASLAGADPGVTVVGVDANVSAVEFARKQFDRPNLVFQACAIGALSFPDESFDRISLLEVIEHIYERQASDLLRLQRRLLRPGGRLVISTPNGRSLWPLLEWTLDRTGLVAHMRDDQHVASYHPASLRLLCESAGFRLLNSRTLFLASPALAMFSSAIATRALGIEERSGAGALVVQSFEPV